MLAAGRWPHVVINFAFSFAHPCTARDWHLCRPEVNADGGRLLAQARAYAYEHREAPPEVRAWA